MHFQDLCLLVSESHSCEYTNSSLLAKDGPVDLNECTLSRQNGVSLHGISASLVLSFCVQPHQLMNKKSSQVLGSL